MNWLLTILRRFAAALRLLSCAVLLVAGFAMLFDESAEWQLKGFACIVAALVVAPLTLKGKLL